MNIKPDFSRKIIISAVGEFQVKLLFMIYASMHKQFGLQNAYNTDGKNMVISEKNLDLIFKNIDKYTKHCSFKNIKVEVLFVNNIQTMSMSEATVYHRRKLQNFLIDKDFSPISNNSFLKPLINKINLGDYNLVTMKVFINLYGKYLFTSKSNHEIFVAKYQPYLHDCNIFKTIKELKYD